jgi:ATP-dependent helicase/nuclease subunit B
VIPPAALHIGLHRGLQRPAEGSREINVVRGGPGQLLAWLESQLGLVGPDIAWTDRVVQYHAGLRNLPSTSFEGSFKADSWATTSNLLRRRDALLMAGWNPAVASGVAVADQLATLESSLLPGLPDRLALVLKALDDGLELPPHTVLLDEPASAWPDLWQRVLRRLHHEVAPKAAPSSSGALRTIQENLLDGASKEAAPDASLLCLRASSRTAAVQFVARWMRERGDVTVYSPDHDLATMLDAALRSDGQPTMGAPRRSRAHPTHQVLPLVLQLLWEPVNPYVLLDLLLLPEGPLRRIGYRLARALEDQPGYQSDQWNAAVAELLADDPDGKRAQRLAWLDHPRVPLGSDAPTSLVEQRCGLVAQWATRRAAVEAKDPDGNADLVAALQGAATQANAVGKIAARLGATITEAQLERLLDEVREDASLATPFPAEAGGATFVSSLADVQRGARLVWLGTTTPQAPRQPWTPGEVDELARNGIQVSPAARQGALRAAEVRGIANACQLVVLDVDAVEGARHPVWLRIHGDLVVGGRRGAHLPRLEDLVKAGAAGVPTRRADAVRHKGTRVLWTHTGPIPQPAYTSATALEDQVACPLKWTLRYAVGLRPSSTASIPHEGALRGIFAHDMLERVLPPGPPPTPEEVERRISDLFDPLLNRNAAPLAIPRKISERNRLRREIIAAARQFCTVLQEGGYEIVGIEVPTEPSTVAGLPLKGSIDCVLRGPDGEAIVDFKMGRQDTAAKIQTGRALQLATYAHARMQQGATVRAAAYFILSSGRTVTPQGGPLRGVSTPLPGPGVAETWQRFEQALQDARGWMDSGTIPTRPLQLAADWSPGTNAALDAESATQGVCNYCDYGVLCGQRRLE